MNGPDPVPGMNLTPWKCSSCQAEMFVQLPHPEIVNQVNFSAVMLIHNKPEQCPNCKKIYTFVIAGVDNGIQLSLTELRRAEPQSGIVTPTGAEVLAVQRGVPREIKGPGV